MRSLLRMYFGRQGQRRLQSHRIFYRLKAHVILHTPERIGRLVQRAEARVWVDGYQAFPRIERLIRGARHTVCIQMYIWKDDEVGRRMAALLLDVAERGVSVEITKEACGDVFEYNRDFIGTRGSRDALWKRFWSHPGIHVTYVQRNDHAKVYVIDDAILLLTGMNIAEEYRYHWHDVLIELRGRHFVEAYFTGRCSEKDAAPVRLVMNTPEHKEVRRTVEELMASAAESVVIEHAYLSDPAVIAQLIRRSREGVRVTVILPGHANLHHYANMQAVGRLLAGSSAVQVFLFPGVIHGKIILVDHRLRPDEEALGRGVGRPAGVEDKFLSAQIFLEGAKIAGLYPLLRGHLIRESLPLVGNCDRIADCEAIHVAEDPRVRRYIPRVPAAMTVDHHFPPSARESEEMSDATLQWLDDPRMRRRILRVRYRKVVNPERGQIHYKEIGGVPPDSTRLPDESEPRRAALVLPGSTPADPGRR
jgi:hypothetical protein